MSGGLTSLSRFLTIAAKVSSIIAITQACFGSSTVNTLPLPGSEETSIFP